MVCARSSTNILLPSRADLCYVFTATRLFDVGGEDEGVWFADRCSEFLFVSVGETFASALPFSTWPLFGSTE